MIFEFNVNLKQNLGWGLGGLVIYFHSGAHILLIIPSIITPFNWAEKSRAKNLSRDSYEVIISLCFVVHVGIGLYWITVGSVIHVYVIQAWKFSAFPRISVFCVCLVVIFFTLKTRVFIAKRTKSRNVGPTKLRKTNIKIGKYYISQDWNNDYRNPCPYLPSVPILAGHSDFRPSKT